FVSICAVASRRMGRAQRNPSFSGYRSAGFASLNPPYEAANGKTKGHETPTDAAVQPAVLLGTAAPPWGGARLSASHRGSCRGEISSPRRCSRPCFPGRGLAPLCHIPIPGAETDAVFAGVTRLHPSQFKRAPRTPVVSAGRLMPEAARERSAKPPAGTAPAPDPGVPPRPVLYERDLRASK